jgi:hypothetical protein
MSATPINEGEAFSALDGMEVLFLPVVAAGTDIPTRAEIDAGTDLSPAIETWEGFDVDSGEFERKGLARFSGSIPGRITITSGQLTFFADRGGDDVADVLPDGTTGAILFMPNGDIPGDRMNVWPIRVNRLTELFNMEGPNTLRAKFTHPRLPKERVTIPPAA